tara:strand:- start:1627 stop:2631 length:1005 start_codon:yes stop_codon:yes gene_type:complete
MSVNILTLNKPIWFMRQAGRHLPEYRNLRLKKDNFLDFCFDFDCVVESSLQPVRRYDVDCAIVFSDILVIPYLLGQKVDFKKGVGPCLEKLNFLDLLNLEPCRYRQNKLNNSYRAIKKIRKLLDKNKSLIGFCGAPWTVACYMIDGNSKGGFGLSKESIKKNKNYLSALLDKIVDVSIKHLVKQIENGCDTLMIFESWAGLVDSKNKKDLLYKPLEKIIQGLRKCNIEAPIIVFPKGLGTGIIDYTKNVHADVLSIDHEIDLEWAIKNIRNGIVLQGNLNPKILEKGGNKLDKELLKIKKSVGNRQHIFNLGHGLLPGTPIEHVHRFIEILRSN